MRAMSSVVERAGTIRVRILYSVPYEGGWDDVVKKYLEIASDFEDLWRELNDRFKDRGDEFICDLGANLGVFYEYIVYLALSERWGSIFNLPTKFCFYRTCYSFNEVCAMTALLLNLITRDEVRKSGDFRQQFNPESYLIGWESLPKYLRPAVLKVIYGVSLSDCKDECERNGAVNNRCYQDCMQMLDAIDGDKNAINALANKMKIVLKKYGMQSRWSGIPKLIKEVLDYTQGINTNPLNGDWRFFGKSLAELLIPTTSRIRFILMLHDLVAARDKFEAGSYNDAFNLLDLAIAHAYVGKVKFRSRTPGKDSLASDLFNTAEITLNELKTVNTAQASIFDISPRNKTIPKFLSILLKLYHYHVQTYLNEVY
jgi:hypothetical protein